MAAPFIGEIKIFAGNFAPLGYAYCNGQILPIAQNTALFSLVGTTYGGDGMTTFALPDLRGRMPMHPGNGYSLGEQGGSETVTVTVNELPAHSHPARGVSGPGNQRSPVGNVWAAASGASPYSGPPASVPMAPLQPAGGNQPHDNLSPFLAVSFIIALEGLFPPRS